MSSAFSDVSAVPPIEVFHLNARFNADTFPQKVSLGVGAYRDNAGKPWVLPVVKEAERALAADNTQNHEYLPILGFEPFSKAAAALVLGENSKAIAENRVLNAQCLSGTGSLRIAAEFLHSTMGYTNVLVSKPTWGNHKTVFQRAGFTNILEYRYWNQTERSLDFAGMLEDLKNAPEKTVAILHGCAHNPTGCDPSKDQWNQICAVMKEKKIFPLMDIAYQGFASGDTDEDAWAVRNLVDQGFEFFIAQSFAKNFGLYNERIGNLAMVLNDPAVIDAVKSRIAVIIRCIWSNPPNHGAKVVHMVLTNPEMRAKWLDSIKVMSGRIKEMRSALKGKLAELGTPGNWNHITSQIGMFSFTGLSEAQVSVMTEKHHIYMLKNGRISIAGLNTGNVEYVAKAMDDAVRNA